MEIFPAIARVKPSYCLSTGISEQGCAIYVDKHTASVYQ